MVLLELERKLYINQEKFVGDVSTYTQDIEDNTKLFLEKFANVVDLWLKIDVNLTFIMLITTIKMITPKIYKRCAQIATV